MIDSIFQSFWTFAGSVVLVAVFGYFLVSVPVEGLIKIKAIRSLEKLKAKGEIAVMGGLECPAKEPKAREGGNHERH